MNKVIEKTPNRSLCVDCLVLARGVASSDACFLRPHDALDRQGMEQNAPILSLLAGHSAETGYLPTRPPSWGTLFLQPRKCPDVI